MMKLIQMKKSNKRYQQLPKNQSIPEIIKRQKLVLKPMLI